VKYGAAGVYVDVKLRTVAAEAELMVTNYGPAIPQEDLPHIFQQFYRVEQSRSRQTGGTGLGLAIAANIVQMHGGNIAVASGAAGTSFRVRLPIAVGK
jgi:signal transduction histidine kinase